MDRPLVHFVASDALDPTHRPPVLSEAFHWIAAGYGRETADQFLLVSPSTVPNGD